MSGVVFLDTSLEILSLDAINVHILHFNFLWEDRILIPLKIEYGVFILSKVVIDITGYSVPVLRDS